MAGAVVAAREEASSDLDATDANKSKKLRQADGILEDQRKV